MWVAACAGMAREMTKKRELEPGMRVRIARIEQGSTGEPLSEDLVGAEGTITWVTPGFAGERAVFEVQLGDGRVLNLWGSEIEAAARA